MKIDDKHMAILKELRDGRRSFHRIAETLGLSENTVRARVNEMVEAGVLVIAGLADPEALPGHRLVVIGVKLASMDLVAKGEEFRRLRGVVSVGVVTGRFDLMVTVLLKEGFDLLQFYTEWVSRVQDVQSVETFVVYKGFDLRVPYVL